jgi:hypothetical protein
MSLAKSQRIVSLLFIRDKIQGKFHLTNLFVQGNSKGWNWKSDGLTNYQLGL